MYVIYSIKREAATKELCRTKFNVNAKSLFMFKQGQIHQTKLNKNHSKTELTEFLIIAKSRITA